MTERRQYVPLHPTARQLECLAFVARYIDARGYAPSIREISDAFGFSSTNGASDNLRALERKGLLERTPIASRAMRITELGRAMLAGRPWLAPAKRERRERETDPGSVDEGEVAP